MDPQVKSAIAVGQTYQLQQLIFRGADTNARDSESHTPLILAAKQGCVPIFQLLHRAHADPEACDDQGRSPIHYACTEGHMDLVRYLVGCVAKRSCDVADESGYTPMMLAAEAGHTEICKLLIKQVQVDMNAVNSKRQTALHFATSEGHSAVVQLLIRSGATVDRRDDHDLMKGETPLMYAAKYDRKQILKMLLHAGADNTKLNKLGNAAITLAAAAGHLDIIKELLRNRSSVYKSSSSKYRVLSTLGDSPLVAAAANGQVDVVQYLLKARFTRYLNVAVMNATLAGHTDVVRMIIDYLPGLVFHQSEDVFLIPKMHQDVFLLAVTQNQEEIVSYLIKKRKVDINGWTPMGRTALHEAVNAGHIQIVRQLIANGARLNSRDKLRDLTPLLGATYMGHTEIVELLLTSCGQNTKEFNELINARDTGSNTVLHYAVMKGHINVVRTLLTSGVDPQLINSKKQTAMHLAVQIGCEPILKLLLYAGGTMTQCSHDGNTPLHLAVSMDSVDLVWFTLDQPHMLHTFRKANSVNGLSPIQVAAVYGRERMCHFLMEHAAPQQDLQRLLVANDRTVSLSDAMRRVADMLAYEPLRLFTFCVCVIRESIQGSSKSSAVRLLHLPQVLRDQVALLHYRELSSIVLEDRL